MDDVLVNTSTRLKTRHAVIEADSNAAMKKGVASPPTSKSARPKPIRRNVERFRRLRLRKIQMIKYQVSSLDYDIRFSQIATQLEEKTYN